MTQAYENVMEIEGPKVEQIESQISEESKMDELLGDLNPRYFEEAMSPVNALDKVYSAKVQNHLIRPF